MIFPEAEINFEPLEVYRLVDYSEKENAKGERGDKPYDLELMLRLYVIQNLILADSPNLTA